MALLVRIGLVLATPDYRPVLDPADYDRYARSIAKGDGYPETHAPAGGPTAYRPPLYPAFLAAAYKVTGRFWSAARLAQALVGTLTVALVGLVGWQLWGRRVALIAMTLAALYLPLMIVGTALLSEVLVTPLVLAALACVIQHRRSAPRARWALAAGTLIGLATLARPNAVLLALPLGLAVIEPGRGRDLRGLVAPIALVGALAITIAPWTIRNLVVMDAVIPVSTQGGFTLAGTYNDVARNHPRYPAVWVEPTEDRRYLAEALATDQRETSIERKFRSLALDYIGAHPLYVAEAGFWNTARLLHLSGGRDYVHLDAEGIGIGPKLADAGMMSFFAMAALAILGLFTSAARRAPWFFWATPVAMMSAVFIVAYIRFRAPIDPFVILAAALMLSTIDLRRVGRGDGRAGQTST